MEGGPRNRTATVRRPLPFTTASRALETSAPPRDATIWTSTHHSGARAAGSDKASSLSPQVVRTPSTNHATDN